MHAHSSFSDLSIRGYSSFVFFESENVVRKGRREFQVSFSQHLHLHSSLSFLWWVGLGTSSDAILMSKYWIPFKMWIALPLCASRRVWLTCGRRNCRRWWIATSSLWDLHVHVTFPRQLLNERNVILIAVRTALSRCPLRRYIVQSHANNENQNSCTSCVYLYFKFEHTCITKYKSTNAIWGTPTPGSQYSVMCCSIPSPFHFNVREKLATSFVKLWELCGEVICCKCVKGSINIEIRLNVKSIKHKNSA